MKDKKSTSQPNRPTMKNRTHEERINEEKNNHDGKLFPYFLLTFLCAGLEISVAILVLPVYVHVRFVQPFHSHCSHFLHPLLEPFHDTDCTYLEPFPYS